MKTIIAVLRNQTIFVTFYLIIIKKMIHCSLFFNFTDIHEKIMKLRILILLLSLMSVPAFATSPASLSNVLTTLSASGYNTYRVVWHPEKEGFYNAVVYSPGSETWAFIQILRDGQIKNEYLIGKPRNFKGDANTLNLMPAVSAVTAAGYRPTAATWTPNIIQIDAVTSGDTPVKLNVNNKTNVIIQ